MSRTPSQSAHEKQQTNGVHGNDASEDKWTAESVMEVLLEASEQRIDRLIEEIHALRTELKNDITNIDESMDLLQMNYSELCRYISEPPLMTLCRTWRTIEVTYRRRFLLEILTPEERHLVASARSKDPA